MYAAEPAIRDAFPDPTDPDVYGPANAKRLAEPTRVIRGPALPADFKLDTSDKPETVAYVQRDFESCLRTAAAWGFVPSRRTRD